MSPMNDTSRNGFRWSINECLQLHREYELLELSIDEIATKHKRTPRAIIFKLDQEGLADYNTLYNYYNSAHYKHSVKNSFTEDEQLFETHLDEDEDEDEEYDDEEDEDYEEEDDDDDEEDEDYEEEEDTTSLKNHIIRLEKKLNDFMELMLNQSKGKNSVFSMFS